MNISNSCSVPAPYHGIVEAITTVQPADMSNPEFDLLKLESAKIFAVSAVAGLCIGLLLPICFSDNPRETARVLCTAVWRRR